MGGSLLVALNAFMKRKMTQNSLQAWRKKGDLHLQNARQPELCERSQTDAAFDACYMYARCIAGEKSELRSHSDTSILVLVAAKLGWHHCVLRPARQHVRRQSPAMQRHRHDVVLAQKFGHIVGTKFGAP